MKKYILLFVLFIFSIGFYSMKNVTSKTGFIHKVVIEVDEHLREHALVKDRFGEVWYDRAEQVYFKEETEYEKFNKERVNSIVSEFATIIATSRELDSVGRFGAGENIGNMFGNIASNAVGKSKMEYFPQRKLKKVKEKADEYYTIKIGFKWGGEYGNVKKGIYNLKFSIKIKVTATNNKGDILWKKEEEIKDFTSIFKNSTSTNNGNNKHFEISREPRMFNKYNIVFENENNPIGDFLSLSLDEFEECMMFAMNYVLNN